MCARSNAIISATHLRHEKKIIIIRHTNPKITPKKMNCDFKIPHGFIRIALVLRAILTNKLSI